MQHAFHQRRKSSLHTAHRVEMTIQGRGLKPLALQAPTVSTTDILPRTTADHIAHAERSTCPIHFTCVHVYQKTCLIWLTTSLASLLV